MRIPQVAFLGAGLSDKQRMMAGMGLPVNGGPSMEEIEAAWNQRLGEIAERAVPGSVRIGEMQLAPTAMIAMVTFEIERE